MKPVDMKVTRKEADKAVGLQTPASPSTKIYPWGLEIRLDSAALDKLGMKTLPEVGTECAITAVGEVTEVRQAAAGRGNARNISIQIKKLAVDCDDAEGSMAKGFAKGPKRSKGY